MLAMRTLALISFAALAGAADRAHADIRSFNASVQAGDFRAAAADAQATWPAIDRAAPDVAQIAREFAWVSMLADDPSAALVYARFLVEQGARLPNPDPSPAVSRVLFDWASLRSASSANSRSRLYGSLRSRANLPGRDLISVRAAQALQVEAWNAGDWTQAEGSSLLALRFLDDIGAGETVARYEARRRAATANFMRTKSPDAYNSLYDMAGQVHDQLAQTPPGTERDQLAAEYFAAAAWADAAYPAMSASDRRNTPDRRQSFGAGQIPVAELVYPAPGEATLPRCRISLARSAKTPGFPFVARFRDLAGVVTYALEVRPDGSFANPRLLAAAPHPDFVRATEDVMSSWTWRLEAGSQPGGCRMPLVHVLTLEFALGR